MIYYIRSMAPKFGLSTTIFGYKLPEFLEFDPKEIESCEDVTSKSRFDKLLHDDGFVAEGYKDRSNLDWRDRLKLMYRYDHYGCPSPELNNVISSVTVSTIIGFVMGGYLESKKAFQVFMEINKHEMFKHPREAQMALMDRIILSFVRGGCKLSWRMALMTGTFLIIGTSLTAMRNKVNPLDHALAGSVMGASYNVFHGPRKMLVGSAVGAVLGLSAGTYYWTTQYLSGETVEERWKKEYDYVQSEHRRMEGEKLAADPRSKLLDPSVPLEEMLNDDQDEQLPVYKRLVNKVKEFFDTSLR